MRNHGRRNNRGHRSSRSRRTVHRKSSHGRSNRRANSRRARKSSRNQMRSGRLPILMRADRRGPRSRMRTAATGAGAETAGGRPQQNTQTRARTYAAARRVPQAQERTIFQQRRSSNWGAAHRDWRSRGGYFRLPHTGRAIRPLLRPHALFPPVGPANGVCRRLS